MRANWKSWVGTSPVTAIEESVEQDVTPKSDPEDPLPLHEITDEGENIRSNEKIKSWKSTYLKKETDIYIP